MTLIVVPEQRSPEWFKQRQGLVTASAVGAILGHAPYMTRDDVMRRMVRDFHGLPDEFQGNIATDYGTNMEPGAVFDFTLKTGLKVESCGFFSFEGWAGGTPDGLIGRKSLLEVKCPFGIRNDNPPVFKTLREQPHYYDQVQFQLLVTLRTKAYFYQWTAYGDKVETVGFDVAWRNENIPLLEAFFEEYLVERERPDSPYLEEKRVEIETPTAAQMLTQYDELGDQLELIKAKREDIITKLAEMTKGKNGLICGRKFTLVEKAGAVSYAKTIKALLPDADLEPYRGKPSEFWKLS